MEKHPNTDPKNIDFRVKILSSHKTALERQVREAVLISEYNGPFLLNNKIEYSHTMLPRLETKMVRNKEKKEDPEVEKEKSLIERIKLF